MILQNDTVGASNIWSSLNSMWYMNLTQLVGSSVSSIWAPAITVVAVFASFLSAIVMYYPAIFTGYFIWFWWCICLPIAIGFIISIVTIIRGVNAGG
jgi:hypothetical protein